MTLLYRDERFLDHDTGGHPESAGRLAAVHAELDRAALASRCERPSWNPADDATLSLVHTPEHLAMLTGLAERGGGRVDADTVVSPRSVDVARLAVGAMCDAVERVVGGEATTALCLPRPPGHHALPGRAMGFCLFNTVAVAAQMAVERLDVDRLLIVDWDVHHGNGTQDAFYRDGRVGFFSAHRWPFYPGTGASDETGAGEGLGATRNLPVQFGTPRREYLARFTGELKAFADRLKPQLVLLSAGFDSHAADPIGSLGLETEDFAELTQVAQAIAAAHCEGRLVSVLEGGYNPPVLAECVALHLEGLLA